MWVSMRIWIDLAHPPHVQVFEPVIPRLRDEGHDVLLTVRDHSETADLARRQWPDALVVGGQSPGPIFAKGRAILGRAETLRRLATRTRPDVALSHGSYAQILAARVARVPAVTMMDYEHQPANHLSFRLARRVLVPSFFPETALKRCGASPRKVLRFPGFKEELYLAGFKADPTVLTELKLDAERVIAVMRPPVEGALYHRGGNERFEEVLKIAAANDSVQVVLLPRSREQGERYRATSAELTIPDRAIDGRSILALADLTIGAGGTMTRESAILGTPTYTVLAARLGAADAELIRRGRLIDLRPPGTRPNFEKKSTTADRLTPAAELILAAIQNAIRLAVTDERN